MSARHRRSIYVEDELYAKLEQAAAINGRSTNAEICSVLRAYVGAPAKKGAVRTNRPKAARAPKPINPQAEELVAHLRREVLRNGRPEHLVNSSSWYDPARLLLERDKRDFKQAVSLIEWCQRDSFWRANILSMDTFRRQYDKLRLQRGRTEKVPVETTSSWAGFAARRLGRPVSDVQAAIDRLGKTSLDALARELAA